MNVSNQSPVLTISNFRGYREYKGKDFRILVERNFSKDGSRTLSYIKENRQLLVSQLRGKSIYKFSQTLNGKKIALFLKTTENGLPKVGSFPTKKRFYFDGQPIECPLQNLKSSLERITSKELISKVTSKAAEGFLEPKSCDKVEQIALTDFNEQIVKQLNPDTSFFIKCLNREDVQNDLEKTPKLKRVATQALAKYLDEIDAIANDKGRLKFGCFPINNSEKGKTNALYDSSVPAIRFPVSEGQFVTNSCKNMDQLFAHEMIHQVEDDEENVRKLDTLCALKMGISTASDEKCKNEYSNKTVEGTEVTQAIQNVNQNLDKETQQQIQPILQAEIKPEEFKPIAQSDLDAVISEPANSPKFNSSMERIYTTLNQNFEGMARPLNKALAATTSAAYAGTSSKNKVATARSRSIASTSNGAVQEYVAEEILVDKYGSPSPTTILAQAPKENLKSAATTSERNQKAAAIAAATPTDIGGSQQGAGAGESIPLSAPAASNSKPNTKPSNSRSVASLPSSQTASNMEGSLTKELSVFSEIKGQNYARIKEQFTDKKFRQELIDKNIAIKVSPNKFIGADPDQAKLLFIDNGQSLRRQGVAK